MKKGFGLDDLIYKYIDKKKDYPTTATKSSATSKNVYAKRVEIKNLFKNQVEDRLKESSTLSTKPLRNVNNNGNSILSSKASLHSSVNRPSQSKTASSYKSKVNSLKSKLENFNTERPRRPISPYKSPIKNKESLMSSSRLSASVWSPSPVKNFQTERVEIGSSIEKVIPIESIHHLTRYIRGGRSNLSHEYQKALVELSKAVKQSSELTLRPLNL
ncbi:unnamed protein product [Moneuplotes crassus]|uniref:Uncharacterized protein n=1 Tax=Euplotes crassus TaxID=5936 RepID=A0AAD1XXZ6_EUPCR|nr:unnamed protein product [Moneuplotes crassus]